jgi:hypothetical protein
MLQWKRVLAVLEAFVLACVAYLWSFGLQTVFVLEARNTARKLPFLKRTPVGLTDLSVSEAPGMKLSYFGCEFEIPWTDIDKETSKIVGGNKAVIAFRSGNVVMVWSAPPRDIMNGVLADRKLDRNNFQKIDGDGVLQSDYDFMRMILETTPNKITISDTAESDAG